MAVFDARSMQDICINRAVKTPTVIAEIVSTLGVMGLTLAVVGLYGLAAYSVSRRTREIGIRMALGADPLSVTKMVLKQGLVLGLAGVAVGLLIGFFACRAITSGTFQLRRPCQRASLCSRLVASDPHHLRCVLSPRATRFSN